jgi:hypothetical protein
MAIQSGSRVVPLAAILTFGCGGHLSFPTAPAELTSGVAIYEHADYAGESAVITEDQKNLKDVLGPCGEHSDENGSGEIGWSDCMSSVRIAPGWRAILYRDDGFKGEQLEVTGDVPNLTQRPGTCSKGGLNDCVTSIRVFRP